MTTPPAASGKAAPASCTYGAPVLPGAMFLLGYFDGRTRPSWVCPAASCTPEPLFSTWPCPASPPGVEMTRADFAVMGEGGLCLGCKAVPLAQLPLRKINSQGAGSGALAFPQRLSSKEYHAT